MRTLLGALALALAIPLSVSSAAASASQADTSDPASWKWQKTRVDKDQSFRGLDAVDDQTAWVAGENITDDGGPGTVYRTTDGGTTWQDVSPVVKGADLAFRDVEAKNADVASVLAIGEGRASRIYRTTDGGATWTKTFQNKSKDAFYNCIDFYPGGRTGLGVSDPVDGEFRIIRTTDGGRSWGVLKDAKMPAAFEGEFNFAASGTCLTITGRQAYMGSGGAAARVYHSKNKGEKWTVTSQTIPATNAGGVFSLSFKSKRLGVAVGGDFEQPESGTAAASYKRKGSIWRSGGDLSGYRSGSDYVDGSGRTFVAVGPTGSDVSTDGGTSWTRWSRTGYHAVVCVTGGCWASGSEGRTAWVATQ